MEKLGFYAKDSKDNLFQFKWGRDNTFYILIDGRWNIEKVENYTILEIGYFISE